ncbi:MAG: NAD(P)H-quinone oxidoreductase [Parvularcula sp.]|jgi:putative PIG3 family NAD(P)H quinone oxidoreductase|nr:NAD(P)H-quinone oxidoreductase [Parvularcula sp.]
MTEAHAWFVKDKGALSWENTTLPPLGDDDVLIDVKAAGINRPDLLQRAGVYPPPAGAPQSLGLEVAGIVLEVGSAVSGFSAGDRVMALVAGGGYATHSIAHEGSTLALPPGMSFEQAAAFPETAFTVFANVFEAGRLAKGERLFVHGATSGIGTMAAAMASALGHEVYGTAGTLEKITAAQKLGFNKVWNHKTEDWSAAMQAAGGCHVVLDMVGGDYVPRNLAMLREGGRHVSIAFLNGIEATISIVDIMRRQLTLTGSTLRARSATEKSRLRGEVEGRILPLFAAGEIAPHIGMQVPMAEVERAHQAMQTGALIGKAVLTRKGHDTV